ncbi:MAG TPA: T9SS type A sorting domain-containing protein [Bacteroidia bacterium]|jgi:hypothetical protein|nr:T9SS type A sorting domain-containing protein [Bacteroidia bacterium]
MKKILAAVFVLFFVTVKSQVIFSDSYNTLTLQNDVQVFGSKTVTTTYTTAPAGYSVIDDGFKNNVGSINAPNKPFNVVALKTTGWAVGYNAIDADTFLVSTSWLDTTAADQRFIVSPVINSIAANSVLSWEAKSPDINFLEGYEVYVTTNTTGTLTSADFTPANRVYYVADGNTAGQGEKSIWTKHGLSLATYSLQNVRIAFKDISQGMYQLWIDNVKVENITNANDVGLTLSPQFYNYNTANTSGYIFCSVTNFGNINLTNLTLNYSVIGLSNQSESFGFSSMTPYAVSDFTFGIPYNIATPGYYKLKIWVNTVNGVTDQNLTNDTINTYLCIVTSVPVKNTLVEQFVSAYDGNTPEGQETLKALTSGSVVAVNIHDADSLAVPTISTLISTYRKKTTTAMVDRAYFTDVNSVPVDRPAYATHINERRYVVVPASVSIINENYDSITRILTFTVKSDFVGEVKGDYRMNAYVTENNVYGPATDTTYNGWNQLSFMYNVPFSPYYQLGYYLSAPDGYVLNTYQYKHQNVLDAALDGSFGTPGIIPTTGGTQGQTFTVSYSYTVPPSPPGQFRYMPNNMYIVAYVSEYNADQNYRTVLNCTQDKINTRSESMVSVNELKLASQFSLYPNPSYGITNILIPENSFKKHVNISILDVVGKEVYNQNSGMSFGLIQLNLYHLESGTYFIVLSDGNTKATKKLIITK